jgi:hypothetical protein
MKVRSIAAFCVLVFVVSISGAATVTVTTADNNSLPGDGVTSLDEALRAVTDGDSIRFSIPSSGPHYIKTPIGGYPLITAHNLTIDGYSQPGSKPNTNSILGGNGAQIQIVLDSTGDEWLPNDPQDPGATARRSTRILYSGYGNTENGILAVLEADNFVVRGLSFISRRTQGTDDDPVVYAVALVNEATNARVQGCWFGIAPGGSTMADVKPVASAVAAFRFQIGGSDGPKFYSSGCIIGTDGDGLDDRAEFNVIVGCRIAMALELPGARIAGNYVNVFPDGLSFVDIDQSHALWWDAFIAGGENPEDLEVSVENLENGDLPENSIIGTNGDGVSDADERNVFGNTVYDNTIEFYRAGPNIVLAGNYFGVGVDGVTPAPVSTNVFPDFLRISRGRTNPLIPKVRVGSNGDGISDDVEGNVIFNVRGPSFFSRDTAGTNIAIVSQRNRLVNCNVSAVPFSNGSNVAYTSYYAPFLVDSSAGVVPLLTALSGGELKGSVAAPSAAYPYVTISVYLCDMAGMSKTNFWPSTMTHPGRHLLSFADNGPEDLDLDLSEFSVDLSALGVPAEAYLTVAATYSGSPVASSATNAVTSPMSNPISREPRARLRLLDDGNSEISWIAPPGVFALEVSDNLSDPLSWFPIATGTYHLGRYIATVPTDYGSARVFFRVVAP